MEERPPIWRVDANILNKQSRAGDKMWYSSLGLVEVLTTTRPWNLRCYEPSRTDPLVQIKQWKRKRSPGVWKARSLV
jgi:hypothetical protein